MKHFNHTGFISVAALLFMIIVMFVSMYVFKAQIAKTTQALNQRETAPYDTYYVMIVEDTKSAFWNSVYQKAKEIGEENNIYVELMGTQLANKYSKDELMRIAIDSCVDGIFLEADERPEMTELINEAVEQKIPVITVVGDNTTSKRQSFVGISSYNLGREYGNQVLKIAKQKETKVLILMPSQSKDTAQNLIFSGIQEVIESASPYKNIQLESIAIDVSGSFAAEESIRDIFIASRQIPDILICLDEVNTASAYQAIVDFNKVGIVNLLGYYDSETILNAIARKVIYATIAVQPEQIAGYLMEAITEYRSVGQVNEYYPVDTALITAENVDEYLQEEENEK